MHILIFATTLIALCSASAPLQDVYEWKDEVCFDWPNHEVKDEAIQNQDYIPKNNLPLGFAKWNNKLFVTIPRWKAGVASTLNYIDLNNANKSAPLIPYPNWEAHALPKGNEKPSENLIVSSFRIKVDACDRLWVMETGLADILGDPKQIVPPSILIFDLNTDKLIRKYILKHEDIKGEESFFANIVVDVLPGQCDKAFAYIPDLGGYGLVVYSFENNDSWRVKHNYFHFDPLMGDLTVGGINFQWTDGIFSVALGPADKNGFRTAYFHPLASTNEFSVNTQILKNKTLAQEPHSYGFFKLEGNKGKNAQTSGSVFDEKTNILFLTQLQNDGIACWNPKTKLEPQNLGLIAQDHEKLIFTNDMMIDQDRNLWFLSDRMPAFLYTNLNPNEVNYRILKTPLDEAIKGTPCVA